LLSRRQFLICAFLSGAGLITTDAFCFERYVVEKNEFDIGDKAAGPKIRIVQISDLHLKAVSWYHDALVQGVNDLRPDIIIFTGDTIQSDMGLPLIDRLLPMFDRKIRKVAVPGNWELAKGVNLKEMNNIFKRNNGGLLINKSETLIVRDKRLTITGLDDMMAGRPDFAKAVQGVGGEKNHIVLAHCPAFRDHIVNDMERLNRERPGNMQLKIDYVFSGHTHGGQVNLFGFAPFLPPAVGRYLKGWYKEKLPHLYVSKGIGTSILPIRFGARAELAVFNYGLV